MDLATAHSGQVLRRGDDVVVAIAPRLLGVEVAALVYGISADTIADLQDAGQWPVVRIGNRRLVPVAAVDAWIAEQTAA
jgi:excisionase family DNA binding protein